MSDNDSESKIRRLMRESLPETDKVIDFASAAKRRGRPVRAVKPPAPIAIHIQGSSNAGVIGNNNQVHIDMRGVRIPRPQITPGIEEIDNAQAAEVKRLVYKTAEVSGRPHAFVYNALYRRYETTSYLMIKRHRYNDVVSYLHKWIASCSPPSQALDASGERRQLLKRIHAQSKKVGGSLDQIRAFTSGRFGTPSLAELSPAELREVIWQFRL